MRQEKKEISNTLLKKVAKEASLRAVKENFALGLSVTVVKNGHLVQINPDGTEVILKKVKAQSKRITQKRIVISGDC